MKRCNKKLKEIIEDVVLPDLEDHMDTIFETIANDKKANDQHQDELQELHEMRDEFNEILQEIENNELSQDECEELYAEITDMISDNEE